MIWAAWSEGVQLDLSLETALENCLAVDCNQSQAAYELIHRGNQKRPNQTEDLKPFSIRCLLQMLGTRLMGVNFAAKAGVAILALLLAALPVMACTVPGATMTAAERDCCKRMAEQCHRSGMVNSHGCCQTQASPNGLHALKTSSSQLDHSLIDIYAQPVAAADTTPPLILTASMPSPTHSPPGLIASATTVLRI